MSARLTVPEIFVIFFTRSFLPEVAGAIGSDNTVKLISIFGGSDINLPSKKDFLKVCRNISIYIGYNEGLSFATLAQKYNLSQQRTGQLYRETKAQIEAYYALKAQGLTHVRLMDPDSTIELAKVHEALQSGQGADITTLENEE